MANKKDLRRDAFQLTGRMASNGYDWWWHSFSGKNARTQETKRFFIEFFLINPALGGKEAVFGQLSPEARPSYAMIKAGAWGEDACQIHRFFAWEDVTVGKGVPFSVIAKDCYLDEACTYGNVCVAPGEAQAHPEYMCDSGEMKWSLKIDKKIAFNVGYGASPLFRRLGLFEMFWHAEGMKALYEGEVVFNGEAYVVEPGESYGYADKNWGKDFTSPWVWLASSDIVSLATGKRLNDTAFDIGGGRPKCGPFVFPRQLLSQVWHEGKCYEFNFSKFWTFPSTRFHCDAQGESVSWHVEQRTLLNRMTCDITCQKKDMVLVNYEAPDGKKRHNKLFNGGTGEGTLRLYRLGRLVDSMRCESVGCEYGEYDE